MPKSKASLPEEFKSIEEIQVFWNEHSTADYWNEMEDVDLELSPALKSKLELKKLYSLLGFSLEQVAEIEAKAKREKVDSRELIRKLVLERV
jgi:hypothetical protein